jgi:hypothetical protein
MSNQIISKQISPIVTKAEILEIVSSETLEIASDFRSKLKAEEKRLKEDKEKITKPLNEGLKEVRLKYKPAEDIIEQALLVLNSKMSEYQMSEIQRIKKEEEKIANKIGKGLSIEKASEKIANLAPIDIPKNTGFHMRQSYEITSPKDLPREYLVPNEVLIFADLKKGIEIKGAKLTEILVPVNKRN